jgi:uncharacterized protein YuzE
MDDRFGAEVEMNVDYTGNGMAYISYRPGRGVHKTLEVGGEGSEVLADLNEAGEVLGIEIIDVNVPENVEVARRFAAERGLELPPLSYGRARAGNATEH